MTIQAQQEVNIISESGMYTLILRCRDAVKKGSIPHRFRKWVTSEVLPAIRKTGKYQLQPQQLALPEPEKFTFEFTEYELEQLVWLWCGHKQMNTLLGDMIKPLETIGSYFTGYGDVVIQLVKVTAERDKCASQVDNLNTWINQAKGGK